MPSNEILVILHYNHINNSDPGYMSPNNAEKVWIRKIYNNSGKTVVIWKKRNIRATNAMMSALLKLSSKF